MYESDTILALKEQRPNDPETDEPFAYNEVKVIGESPVSHADKGDWTGDDARGVIIVPLSNFGGTLDEPFGKLRQIYDVKSAPVVEVGVEPKIRVYDGTKSSPDRPTPEQVFQTEAPGVAPEPGQKRARTPLGPPGGPEDFHGPLGEVKPPRA